MTTDFNEQLKAYRNQQHPLLPEPYRHWPWYHVDMTAQNAMLDTQNLNTSIEQYLKQVSQTHPKHLIIGGYGEKRVIYQQPQYQGEEPRCIHLGLDITLKPQTPLYTPFGATIHSYADNQTNGDYGPTLILEHQLGSLHFYSLYGHLSRASLKQWQVNAKLAAGECLGTVGSMKENGGWTPHLHLQLIRSIQDYKGTYPGVATASSASQALSNCPDPSPLIHPSDTPKDKEAQMLYTRIQDIDAGRKKIIPFDDDN